MLDEKGLLPHQPSYRIPRDAVGARPEGEPPAGTVRLAWLSLVALRYHFWQVLLFVLLAGLGYLFPMLAVALLAAWLTQAGLPWAAYLTYIALWPVTVPLGAGLSHAILLVIQGYRPPGDEVWRPLLSLRLYGKVLAAGLPAAAVMWAAAFVPMLAHMGPRVKALVGCEPWGTWLGALPGALVAQIVALPFVFAALDAVATWSPPGRSLRRGLRFARRAPALLLGLGAVNIAFAALVLLGLACLRTRQAWHPEGLLWSTAVLFGGLAVVAVSVALGSVLCPVFYREFVWRERERDAAGRPAALESA